MYQDSDKQSETESEQQVTALMSTRQLDYLQTMSLDIISETNGSDPVNISTPEESEEEYSDDDAPDNNEILSFTVDAPEPIRRMILHLARRFDETFPKIAGKRRLHPHEFDQVLSQLRAMF